MRATWYTPPLALVASGFGADISSASQTEASPWWSGALTSLGTAALNIGGAYAQKELGIAGQTTPSATAPPAQRQVTTAATGGMGASTWILPAVIIGGAALFLLMRKR